MEFLKFMFQSFWHFIGFMILFGILSETVIRIVRGYPPCKEDEEEDED